mgnify:CR=1 FL=1|tara:strand:- start:8498 stop:8929 length:432 start_codon:yes stop_codon:yes gene_type:complete
MNCGRESNDTNLHLDAYQIADMIFSDTLSNTELSKLEFSSIDIKTYFEMLIIITTEGMKKFYGVDNKVDVGDLTNEKIYKLNDYLKKIKIKLCIDIISRIQWNFGNKCISYKEIVINRNTRLEELKFILDRNNYIVISFQTIN